MGKLQIDILGTSISIKAKEDTNYLKKLLSYYKEVVSQIEASVGVNDCLQISILAGINLCDELYKEKTKSAKLALNLKQESQGKELLLEQSSKDNDMQEVQKITLDIIDKLDSVL